MVVTFNEKYLEKLYTDGDTGIKKLRFQPQVVRGYQKGIKFLIQAKRKEDLFPFKSLNFEALHGDKEGRYADSTHKCNLKGGLTHFWNKKRRTMMPAGGERKTLSGSTLAAKVQTIFKPTNKN